ncbi:MAG: hypothetical protein LKG25_06750 [Prevotella sp.]|jgi:hypothetical protein|nr:hypothetical protein [Prevotella sp.]MCI1282280.1 hypothetical protein [Prevotella sp.]
METIKKMNKDYIAPECNVINADLNVIMAGSNSDWQVHDGEVPGQGAKKRDAWAIEDENDDEEDWDE